ncbi:MAG TPA: hypothetical protein VNJ53_01530 [Gaiellaceae bacterium]|nr:hypothetical protein [Gaiellaceae bacterium]
MIRAPDAYEERLRAYVLERAEESRAVRVGEKEVSEQAAIVARFRDLFDREQLEALREVEASAATPDERERAHRLARACESGIVTSELAGLQDELQNAELAARVPFQGEELPLRTAFARLGTLATYAEREELGPPTLDVSATLNDRRLELARAGEELKAALSGEDDPVRRSETEKGVSLGELASALEEVAATTADVYEERRERWLNRLLGPERAPRPPQYHTAFVFRLTPLAATYSKERATEVCVATLAALGCDVTADPNIRTDLEDRPQKSPRPVVIAPDPPAVVHLVTRPLGGLQDYQDFLHEAGHALHFAGCEPGLPYAFRALARDNALTETYAYLLQSIVREPGWHEERFGLDRAQAAENAELAQFLDSFMFRRYLAKLRFELDFWSRFRSDGGTPDGYAERLTELTGFVYRADRYLADMDAGFYSADYLRAWIRSAQLRAHLRASVGDDWWRRRETGELLRGLFREALRPSSEDLAARIGYDALDTGPLLAEQAGRGELR